MSNCYRLGVLLWSVVCVEMLMVNFHGLCQLYALFSFSLSVFLSFPFCLFHSLCLINNIFLFPLPNSHSLYTCYHPLYPYHHSLCLITAFLIPFVNSLSLCEIILVFLMCISYSILPLPFSLAFPFCLC